MRILLFLGNCASEAVNAVISRVSIGSGNKFERPSALGRVQTLRCTRADLRSCTSLVPANHREYSLSLRLQTSWFCHPPRFLAQHIHSRIVLHETSGKLTIFNDAGDTHTVRTFYTSLVLLALLPAFLLAPFTHVHLGSKTADHVPLVHSHFSAPSPTPAEKTSVSEADDHDHIAVQLDLFQLSYHPAFALMDLPSAPFPVASLKTTLMRSVVRDVRAHDPPLVATVGLRGPPA